MAGVFLGGLQIPLCSLHSGPSGKEPGISLTSQTITGYTLTTLPGLGHSTTGKTLFLPSKLLIV